MTVGSITKVGFSLPQQILILDPTSNVLLKIAYKVKNSTDMGIYRVSINDKALGKDFYVQDGDLSNFSRVIPWEQLSLSGNRNIIDIAYISGQGTVDVKEIEIVLLSHEKNLQLSPRTELKVQR